LRAPRPRAVHWIHAGFTMARIMSETERAWLAAAIDGEGSIKLSRYRNGTYAARATQLIVSNINPPFIEKCRAITGVGRIRVEERKPWNPVYLWYVQAHVEIKEILTQILPYLIIKKELAEKLIKYVNMRIPRMNLRDSKGHFIRLNEKELKLLDEIMYINSLSAGKSRNAKAKLAQTAC